MKTSTILIIAGIVGNLFVYGGIFFYIYKEKIKTKWYSNMSPNNYIRAIFIFPNNKIGIFNTKYNEDKTFKFNEGVYNVDEKKVKQSRDGVYDIKESEMLFSGMFGNIPTLFYLYGNPNPLSFKDVIKNNNHEGIVELDSMSYKDFIEKKIIREFMHDNRMEIFLLLIVVGNLLLSLLLVAKEFGLIDKLMKKGG